MKKYVTVTGASLKKTQRLELSIEDVSSSLGAGWSVITGEG